MLPSAKYMNLPFQAAIDFFQAKVKLPTENYDDLWKGMHSRAFVVAGAIKNEILEDMFHAIEKGLTEGTTLSEFRKDFNGIVSKHGWKYKGGRGWRTATIFNTNLSVAYSAGHWQAMTDPDVVKMRPYLRYVGSSALNPRYTHKKWYNLILPHNHPFWATHTPPNDWGCKCGVVNHSAREVERLKKEMAGRNHPVKTDAPDINTYEWKDKVGNIHHVPEGIGPGWDYNPGEAAWGKRLADEVMAEYKAMKRDAWENLTPGDWSLAGRPELTPQDAPKAELIRKITSHDRARQVIEKIIGGEEVVFNFTEQGFRHNVLLNAASLAEHIEPHRTPYLPLLPEVMNDPFEIWQGFERHKGTGRVVLRTRYVKAFTGIKKKGFFIVLDARKGTLEGWTIVTTDRVRELNRQRRGNLVFKREN